MLPCSCFSPWPLRAHVAIIGCCLVLLAASIAEGSEALVQGIFPNYDDPTVAQPPLPHPRASGGDPCAKANPIVDAQLVGFGQVVVRHYEPPSDCAEPWQQVVMELSGAVAGVQFDRYGAVWFRGVEVLRTTTPEPSPNGITWRVEKDLSDYVGLFKSPGNVTIMIPNVITSTYTGVLHVNITFFFFSGPGGGTDPPDVLPLRNPTNAANPFTEISVNGAAGQANLVQVPRDTVDARLDLYASGHSCEEFWYTNPLNASSSGGCAGGAYREIRVYVDDKLAGAQYPFPVIYTGGVNPLLWRPLTGILSFDIPAYRFDLTPFLGWLTDGHEHNITLAVVDNWQGTWYLDGVLVLRRDTQGVAGGSVEVIDEGPPSFEQTSQNESGIVVQRMRSDSGYRIRGSLQLANGTRITSEVFGHLTSWSTNRFLSENAQETVGHWHTVAGSVRDGKVQTTVSDFPLEVKDSSAQDSSTFQLNACVKFSRDIDSIYGDYVVARRNHMESCAVYNRSLTNRSQINVQEGQSKEHFSVWAGPKARFHPQMLKPSNLCYSRNLAAHDGAIVANHGQSECKWPRGVYVCGNELCGAFLAQLRHPDAEMVQYGAGRAGGVSELHLSGAEAGAGANGTAGQCLLPMRRGHHLEPADTSQHQLSCRPGTGRHQSAWVDAPNILV